ncbi:MAG: FAD-dependent oxidoreductase [Ilumatobacteraceae bacterium]
MAGLGVAGQAPPRGHRSGATVLVIERTSGGGGASANSEGIFYLGGGTSMQRECGYEDTPENMYRFMRASTTTSDDAALRLFCDQAAAHFDWLEAQGIRFERKAFVGKAVAVRTGEGLLTTGNEKVWPFKEAAAPVPRGHQAFTTPERKGGVTAMRALTDTVEREGIDVRWDTRVVGLVTEGERVVGLVAETDGRRIAIEARGGVVLATGSFNLNPEMTAANLPVISAHGTPLGIDTNDGVGVLLGTSVGGSTSGMNGHIATASLYPPSSLLKGIVVNNRGERFVPEDAYHGRLAYFVEQQPDHAAYLVVDEANFGYPEKGSHRLVDVFEDVTTLEATVGLPPGSVQSTLDRYNAGAETGQDTEFHKAAEWVEPLHPPLAVFDISITSSDYHYIALGGLATDHDGRVLDQRRQPIPGLYAAGACAAHLPQNGGEYASGMSLGPGSFFGRRAGEHAASSAAR